MEIEAWIPNSERLDQRAAFLATDQSSPARSMAMDPLFATIRRFAVQ
jgi:hypothetical protein